MTTKAPAVLANGIPGWKWCFCIGKWPSLHPKWIDRSVSGTKLLEAHDDISRRLLQSLWQTKLLELRSPAAVDRAMIILASHWSVGLPPLLLLVGTIWPGAGWQNNYHGKSDDIVWQLVRPWREQLVTHKKLKGQAPNEKQKMWMPVKTWNQIKRSQSMADSLNSLDSSLEGENNCLSFFTIANTVEEL